MVAIANPNKPLGNSKSYRPNSFLCVPFKVSERFICARREPIIDPHLPKEQAGFWPRRSTVDQVTLLIQKIKDRFSAKKMTAAVFVDLAAAYDTAWHRDLTCKLLCFLPDRNMVSLNMGLVRNRSFTSTLVPESKAGYDALRMASHRVQFWLFSCLISTVYILV